MIAHTTPADPIPATPKLLYSLAEVAELTSLSERFVWGLVDAGDLPAVRVGQRCLVRPADLTAWIDTGCPHPRWTEQQAAAKAARAAAGEDEPTSKPRGRARASRRRKR